MRIMQEWGETKAAGFSLEEPGALSLIGSAYPDREAVS